MIFNRLNVALLVVLALVVGAILAIRPDRSVPNYKFITNMFFPVAAESLSPNPNFRDGKTQQAPVKGTVLRGETPLHYRASAADALRAGRELRNPFSSKDAPAQARGAAVFDTFCTPCHGKGGNGDGLAPSRGFPPPPSLLNGNSVNMKDGQLFHIITFGRGNMPSHAAQVSSGDRWKAILRIRQFQAEAASGEKSK